MPSPIVLGEAGGAYHEDREVVYPMRVDEQGSFLSYNLSHRLLSKRAVFSRIRPGTFYALVHQGQQLRFNLSLNPHLLAPGFVAEKRYGGLSRARIRSSSRNPCHMIGSVQDQDKGSGLAALSTCDGLKGLFHLAGQDFLIEPLAPSNPGEGAAQPHRISRRHIWEHEAEEFISVLSTKGTRKQPGSERWRGHWEEKQQRKRRIKPRSVSKEKWVETLVVADTKMVEYHGSEHVEKYVLTVMNMVAGLFHDASIGNPVHISIVRLIFLEDEEEELKISHHADNTLRSFCKWQKALNPKGDAHPLHHDVAILLTRKDLCTAMNRPCETLGLSHVSGMCQPHRSCNVNEDTGLPLAFTVAHELGHSFGIQHDGSGNDCEPVGKRPFIMSPQLLYDTSPLTWSLCSREYITRFFDRGWGLCLDDPPAKDVINFPSVPPGVLYDVSHQCRLQYGAYSTYCDDMDSVCNTLWCSVGNTCHSKLDAAVDGTKCEENKWCFNGECVSVGYRPEPVHGGWAAWSSWAGCSRTCGAGVQNAERPCNNPAPKYGGKYCLGERKRFRVCNAQPCPADKPSFRQIQCSRFDHRPYKGKLYKWSPVPNTSNPCELHCRPNNEYFAEKLRDAAIDGTPCYEGNSRRDRCINGICKNIGCDYEIDSYAVEDRCGVCHGDGSTCRTVKKTFEESEGLGYVDVGLIPAGAREIQIEEVAEAENFLALRSEDPKKYFLNGGWTIQWNGDYKVAGTTFTYKRMGNWENLTSPGPTEEPVWIQLLFQEKNPGVRYQYTIQQESRNQSSVAPPEFFWHYGPWTKCTATCGTGVQRQMVRCLEKAAGFVEEQHCDALSRPDDKQRNCNKEPCPARWWAGEWQACSATCGDSGLMKRTVLCIQSVALDEQQALPPDKCQHLTKPEATAACNREVLCLALWATGNWSKCSVTCGKGTQRPERPASEVDCWASPCWNRMENSVPDWSGSGSSSQELFNEIDFIPNYHAPKFGPSAPKSENFITEEVLPPNSHKKENVFVDDFYYDYNFINFHEDLAYELVEEKDSKKEDLKPNLGVKISHKMEADPQETLPGLPPTTDLKVKLADQGPTSPTVGQEYEKEITGAPYHHAHHLSASAEASWAVSVPDAEMSSISGRGLLKKAPWLTTELSSGTSPSTSAYQLPGSSRKTQILHHPDTLTPQMPTESNSLDRNSPFPTFSPSALLPSHQEQSNTIEADLETKPLPSTEDGEFSRDRSGSPPLRVPTAGSKGGAGPEVQFQEPEEKRAPSAAPAAAVIAALNVSWEAGNWSECSTTCGLGAVWRVVHCSTGNENDCDLAGKPAPARRCYLRPCSKWHVGKWSKCSRTCGGGTKVRGIHCIDTRGQRPLRPFHCQAAPNKPPTQLPCHTKPCLSWYTSTWRECSELCGGGEQERLVTCPGMGRCDPALRPNSTRPCNAQPCTKWRVGSWGQCTATCGEGIQRRQVKCLNTNTGQAEEDSSLCEHEPWPEKTQRCNSQDCPASEASFTCERDHLSFGFCQTLLWLGRCHLPAVRVQCCQTCHPHGLLHRDRGDEHSSRK
uniref:ADAM metallopeptidase with thrombospondin type 1 motif 7 n=1 Tax=Naja naja TaxID=35670 RepID=A0A8C7E3E1_NAJNA